MAETKPTVKHFRCEAFSQLSIVVKDEVKARFSPYLERDAGENVKVGYLETDDKDVIAILANDGNVEEIDAKDYEKATGPKSFKLPAAV